MPTFRSSSPERTFILVEREADGRQRVGRAVKNMDSAMTWDLQVEHPSGQTWPGTFHGPAAEAKLALVQMMQQTELEWNQDRGNDRPQDRMRPDYNIRLTDDGRGVGRPTILPRR